MCAAIAFAMIIIGIRRNTFNSQGKPVFEDNFFMQTLVLFPDKYDKILPLNFKNGVEPYFYYYL